MDILFLPFIIIYRLIKLPFDLVKYLFLGLFSAVMIVVRIFVPKKDENKKSDVSKIKSSNEKEKKTKKEKISKKDKKEQEHKDLIADKKGQRIALDEKNVKGMVAKSYSHSLKHSKEKMKENASNWYNNLQFVKSSKNKRDINRKTLLIDFESKDAVRSDKKIHYSYLAKNPEGRVIRGNFDAFSKLDVHSFLLSEGYEVYKIKEDKFSTALGLESDSSSKKMSTKDLSFFLTQLSTYIKAGVTLVEAVKVLSKQGKNTKKKKLFQSIIYELSMGESFSEALYKQGKVFPRLLTNMIRTAEMTGQLAETLDNMAEYYEEIEKNRKQVITAMMYPSIIFVMSLCVITFVMIWVVPQFVEIYASADAEVPMITTYVIMLSTFLEENIIFILLSVVVFIIVYVLMFKFVTPFRTLIQWTMMHIPVVKNVIIYNEVTIFTKTFGSLLNHNVLIMESMEILSRLTNNQIYKLMIMDTVANVGRGELLSKAFKDHWAFPETAYQMIVTGERTGQLGAMMSKVAEYYQEQQKNLVTQLKTLVEPIMISFIAVVVGGILLSVVLPMFNLYSAIS